MTQDNFKIFTDTIEYAEFAEKNGYGGYYEKAIYEEKGGEAKLRPDRGPRINPRDYQKYEGICQTFGSHITAFDADFIDEKKKAKWKAMFYALLKAHEDNDRDECISLYEKMCEFLKANTLDWYADYVGQTDMRFSGNGAHIVLITGTPFPQTKKNMDDTLRFDICPGAQENHQGRPLFPPGTNKLKGQGISHIKVNNLAAIDMEECHKRDAMLFFGQIKPEQIKEGKVEIPMAKGKTKYQVPEGHRDDVLFKVGASLVERNINRESRNEFMRYFNETWLEGEPFSDSVMRAKEKQWDKIEGARNVENTFILVNTPPVPGNNRVIRMCVEKAGFGFRKNIRGSDLEGCNPNKEGYEEWRALDIIEWEAIVMNYCEDNCMYVKDFDFKFNNNGTFESLNVVTSPFKFTAERVKRSIVEIIIEGKYDCFKKYLESEKVQERVLQIQQENITAGNFEGEIWTGKLDDSNFIHWKGWNGLVEFNSVDGEGFVEDLIPMAYNKYLFFAAVYPAIYLTYYPGEEYMGSALLYGGEGCFKSSMFRKLLPKHLREHYMSGCITDEKYDIAASMAESIFLEWEEMDKFKQYKRKAKRILAATKDAYNEKWKKGMTKTYRKNSQLMTCNDETPVQLEDEPHRRYIPFRLKRDTELTRRYEEDGSKSYLQMLEDRMDEIRDRIFAEFYVYMKMNVPLALPAEIEKYRLRAIDVCSGRNTFETDVWEAIRKYRQLGNQYITFKRLSMASKWQCDTTERRKMIKKMCIPYGGINQLEMKYIKLKLPGGEDETAHERMLYIGFMEPSNTTDIDEAKSENTAQIFNINRNSCLAKMNEKGAANTITKEQAERRKIDGEKFNFDCDENESDESDYKAIFRNVPPVQTVAQRREQEDKKQNANGLLQ